MVASFFTMLFAKVVAFAEWLFELAVEVFRSLWLFVQDAFVWVFDEVLGVAISALGEIDVSALSGFSASGWGALPSEILNILALIGVGSALQIITAAILVRVTLQLIPFVRLGS